MRIEADRALKKSFWGGEGVMGRGGGVSLFKEGCLLTFLPYMMGA